MCIKRVSPRLVLGLLSLRCKILASLIITKALPPFQVRSHERLRDFTLSEEALGFSTFRQEFAN